MRINWFACNSPCTLYTDIALTHPTIHPNTTQHNNNYNANPIPLTAIAEINYIKHVVMALLYATTTNVSEADKSNLKELEVALQDDDEAQELLQQTGKTGKEFYEEEILPIIMGI